MSVRLRGYGDLQDPVARVAAGGAYGIRYESFNAVNQSAVSTVSVSPASGAGTRIKLLAWNFDTDSSAQWRWETATSNLSGRFYTGTTKVITGPFCPVGWTVTGENEALRLEIVSGTGADIGGFAVVAVEQLDQLGIRDVQDPIYHNHDGYEIRYRSFDNTNTASNQFVTVANALSGRVPVLLACVFDVFNLDASAGAADVRFESPAGTALSGNLATGATAAISLPYSPVGWCKGQSGEQIVIANNTDTQNRDHNIGIAGMSVYCYL